MEKLLEIENLKVVFEMENSVVEAVRDFSFYIKRGEIFALVGESGSGKSVCAHSITGLMVQLGAKIKEGCIKINGLDVTNLSSDELRNIRGGKAAYIFQEPMSSLNPLHTIIKQVSERMRVVEKISYLKARKRAIKLLSEVGIRDIGERMGHYPHQFSGGERQRIMIAMALAGNPELLIADEPTTALDVTVQKQILELIKKLSKSRNMSVLLITHDLGVVKNYAERVAVVKDGLMVETAIVKNLFANPVSEYTKMLLREADVNSPVPDASAANVMCVENLTVSYKGRGKRGRYDVQAVKGASFNIRKGGSLGIVGESGSGKSSLAKGILRLTEAGGRALYRDADILAMSTRDMRKLRKKVQIVFQDPFGSLNPRMTAGMIVGEGLKAAGLKNSRLLREKVFKALDDVRLERDMYDRYPHEFSGGQRQRLAIARAIVLEPEVVFLDEATSSLDKVVQNQVLELLSEIQKKYGVSYVFISHDLSIIRSVCSEVIVIKDGIIVEQGRTDRILNTPEHSYTIQLIDSSLG